MFGIPFTIVREGDVGGVIETIYLRTYRRGRIGKQMRNHLQAYHAAAQGQAKAAGRIPVNMVQASRVAQEADSLAALEKLAAEQESIITESNKHGQAMLDAAEAIAELSLQENYADRTDEIMNKLTDRELHAIVGTIEMGEMPKDFFQFVEARKKASTTGHSGDMPVQSSSAPVTPEATSKTEE
ncbi:MAG: hypothetical protein LLF89_09195 [Spirochaetaceae bacterium]|nr:hypothetical protein [Spirochaetaceae bacterium]